MFIIWICKYYSFKRGFPEKKKVEEWSLGKRTVHTWILISSFVITITSPHNIRLQEKLEFGKKNSRGCWLVNFLKNKNMIRNDSNLLWKRSPYLLSTVWGASDILLTKSKDRRLYTTTRFYFRSSIVHNHCSSL